MRPLRLTISAWGPYPGCETIDFEVFPENGVFLVTGPTGAGKTTIFDGICYALYGNVSGRLREKTSLRSDFAADGTETYVELSFRHRGQSYLVRRAPRYERIKKKGKGTLWTLETAELHRDGAAPVMVPNEVTRVISELLGINYEQFKQIAMIAQGEFMELLMSSSQNKVEIFRSIFQTGCYEKIQRELGERAKKLYAQLQEVRSRMDEAAGNLAPAEDDRLLPELLDAEYRNDTAVLEAVWGIIQRDKKEEKELSGIMDKLEHTIKEQVTALSVAGEARRRLLQKQQLEQNMQRLESQRVQMSEIEEKIRQTKAAEKVEGVWAAWQQSCKRLSAVSKRVKELRIRTGELETRLGEAALCYREKEGLEQEQKKLGGIFSLLEQVKVLMDSVGKKNQEGERKRRKYETLEQAEAVHKLAYEKAEKLFRDAIIGRAAAFVEDGKPCPVCGSLEHPEVAALSVEIPGEEEIQKLKQDFETLHKESETLLYSIAAGQAVIDKENKQLEEAWAACAGGNPADRTEESLPVRMREIQKKLEDGARILKHITENYELAVREKLEAEAQLGERLEQEIKEQEENTRALSAYIRGREGQGFREEQDFLTARPDGDRPDVLEHRLLAWKEERRETAAALQVLEGQAGGEADNMPEPETVEAALHVLEQERAKRRKRLGMLQIRLSANDRAYHSLKLHEKKKKEVELEYGIVSDLDKTAKGNNGERLVFEHYVLAVYFEEIVRAANIRFAAMTDGRFELVKVSRVADARTKDTLGLEVTDYYTGKRRSVKTLSGGEAFKAALALALGLSDVIQAYAGGIEIDTLFVDEGFGALDDESLNQAITVLTELSGRNRMIGIISHVSELKERISRQIVVQKSNSGSSIGHGSHTTS